MLENLNSPANILSSMTSSLSHPHTTNPSPSIDHKDAVEYTIYTCPYLFYPRRIHAYLTLKPLPSNVEVNLVRTEFDSTGQMTQPAGKIEGTIPMMRITTRHSQEDVWIRQSVAVLQYLEETHPRPSAGAEDDMRGATPLARARVSEIVSLVEDASQALGFMVMHSAALYTPLVAGAGGQSRSAFQTAKQRIDKSLATIESYAREGVDAGNWIASTEGLTIADLCLGSLVEYARDMYGWDLREGHEVVRRWVERWERTEAGKPGGEKVPPVWMTELAMKRVWDETQD
jgi:glutathione S-transferase